MLTKAGFGARFAIVLTMTLLLYSLIFQTVDLNFLLEQIQFYVR